MKNIIKSLECNRALEKIRAGDIYGLASVYKIAGKQMYALAYSILGNREDAEDALQESFLKIQHHISDYDSTKNGYNWVLKISKNSAIDLLRKRRENLNIDDFKDEIRADTSSIDDKVAIDEALWKLDETDRQIVVLKVFSRLKFREIAEMMELSVDAIEKRYQRTLKKLKELLSE